MELSLLNCELIKDYDKKKQKTKKTKKQFFRFY